MNPKPQMTQAEFAAHRGVRKSAVSNWKAQGLLVLTPGKGKQQLVDVAATEAKLDVHLDPLRGRPPGDQPKSPTSELGELRVDLLRAQAVRIHMDNARRAGELVALAEFEAIAADWGRRVRERMKGLMRANAEQLAAKTEPREILALLEGEIDKAFEALAIEAVAEGEAASLDADVIESEIAELDAVLQA